MSWIDQVAGMALGLAAIAGFWFWFWVRVPYQDERVEVLVECMGEAPKRLWNKGQEEVWRECWRETEGGDRRAPGVRQFDPNAAD